MSESGDALAMGRLILLKGENVTVKQKKEAVWEEAKLPSGSGDQEKKKGTRNGFNCRGERMTTYPRRKNRGRKSERRRGRGGGRVRAIPAMGTRVFRLQHQGPQSGGVSRYLRKTFRGGEEEKVDVGT